MIGALVSILSLNLTRNLVAAGIVAGTFPITGATATTPIHVTSPNHRVPLGRVVHGVVSGVTGEVEANGTWVLTPTDSNTFALSTFDAQGNPVQSVGTGAYTGGGAIQYALPDYCILLGRRNQALSSAVAAPRVLFVPTLGRAWGFEPYGGLGAAPIPMPSPPPPVRGSRGTAEQQAERTNPQLETEYTTFEVYVTGCAPTPAPDFGDFDATQKIVFALYEVMFDSSSNARVKVLRESWPSQLESAGAMTQRGQQWMGIVEFQQPVVRLAALSFVPVGTVLEFTVTPVGGGSSDATVFEVR